jgi:hypothetical protein
LTFSAIYKESKDVGVQVMHNKTTREDNTIEVLTPWLFIEVFIKPLM